MVVGGSKRFGVDRFSFCLITVVAVEFGLGALLAGSTRVFALGNSGRSGKFRSQGEGPSTPRMFAGMITDSDCGARHHKDSNRSPAQCTRFCWQNGAKYVLIDGDRIYELQGQSAQLDRFAGQRAAIAGTLNGNAIAIVSIKPE
jgi:hypothetical protein